MYDYNNYNLRPTLMKINLYAMSKLAPINYDSKNTNADIKLRSLEFHQFS